MNVSFSADPLTDLQELVRFQFMVNALWAGTIVAVLAAVVGWYMLVRRQAFAGHTLSVMAFPGASGAALAGLPVTWGFYVACALAALGIGRLGPRGAERRVQGATIGTVLGGGAGLLAGLGSLAIPGVGPVVAAGWLIATLTGAAQTALGSVFAALMANDNDWAHRVEEAGRRAGEPVWRLPLHADYADMVKGRYAQLTNRAERREAQAITAAELLHHFAGDVPWAHLDIAGTAYDVPRPYFAAKQATGFGVRLLTELARSRAA